ncbi:hypothetical protein [Streptomyces natalensis]|uniref:Uncharacterized protein n=1 Tax=Streptomyces natalensis ATCC 27448 TaxID=1240678 RepID=A0A0D7CU64_9ACTN|nr:hypothetical protein [Streptomyces natalensis]KIZ19789.1 hypothetical protein SNA_00980 [Streptomyces natalensis ATCC 27448]
MTTEPHSDTQAQAACDELAAALHELGIVLPSLGVDPVLLCRERPRVLLELGRCNLETAYRLTAVLKKAAER